MKTAFPFRGLTAAVSWALVCAPACAGSVETAEQQTRSLLARLPAGSTAIGWIDVTAVHEAIPAERWAEYEAMLENEEDWQEIERFAAATGLDPRTDVKQIAFAVVPTEGAEEEALVLVSASFDRDRLESFLDDAPAEDYQGHTIYTLDQSVWEQFRQTEAGERPGAGEEAGAGKAGAGEQDSGEPDDRPAHLVILDGETALLGNQVGVRLGIDTEAGNRDALDMDPHMNDLVSDVAGEGQIWFVATREAWADELEQIPEGGVPVPTNAIQGIETVTMSMRFGNGLAMRFAGVARTVDEAGLLADSLNGLVATGKMMLQSQQPEMYQILDRAIRVAASDRTISIDANLTDADIDTLRALADEQAAPR